MGVTTAFGGAVLDLLFLNIDLANVGDAAGLQNSATAGSYFISAHTASPGVGGNQTTSEVAYTGYARIAVARSAGGWTRVGLNVSNTAVISFGTCTASPGSPITHLGIGSAVSGVGNLQFFGTVPSYQPAIGNNPEFAAGACDVDLS